MLAEMISPQTFANELGTIDISDKLEAILTERIQAVLDRFKENTPMVGMFLNDSISSKIKRMVVDEIVKDWPLLQQSMTSAVLERFDLQTLIATKIRSMESAQIELTIRALAGPKLKLWPLAAAGLGFLIGLIQMALVRLNC